MEIHFLSESYIGFDKRARDEIIRKSPMLEMSIEMSYSLLTKTFNCASNINFSMSYKGFDKRGMDGGWRVVLCQSSIQRKTWVDWAHACWVALVAQLVECSPRLQSVMGSNPTQESFLYSLKKPGAVDLFALPLPHSLVDVCMMNFGMILSGTHWLASNFITASGSDGVPKFKSSGLSHRAGW